MVSAIWAFELSNYPHTRAYEKLGNIARDLWDILDASLLCKYSYNIPKLQHHTHSSPNIWQAQGAPPPCCCRSHTPCVSFPPMLSYSTDCFSYLLIWRRLVIWSSELMTQLLALLLWRYMSSACFICLLIRIRRDLTTLTLHVLASTVFRESRWARDK